MMTQSRYAKTHKNIRHDKNEFARFVCVAFLPRVNFGCIFGRMLRTNFLDTQFRQAQPRHCLVKFWNIRRRTLTQFTPKTTDEYFGDIVFAVFTFSPPFRY